MLPLRMNIDQLQPTWFCGAAQHGHVLWMCSGGGWACIQMRASSIISISQGMLRDALIHVINWFMMEDNIMRTQFQRTEGQMRRHHMILMSFKLYWHCPRYKAQFTFTGEMILIHHPLGLWFERNNNNNIYNINNNNRVLFKRSPLRLSMPLFFLLHVSSPSWRSSMICLRSRLTWRRSSGRSCTGPRHC